MMRLNSLGEIGRTADCARPEMRCCSFSNPCSTRPRSLLKASARSGERGPSAGRRLSDERTWKQPFLLLTDSLG